MQDDDLLGVPVAVDAGDETGLLDDEWAELDGVEKPVVIENVGLPGVLLDGGTEDEVGGGADDELGDWPFAAIICSEVIGWFVWPDR